jgi:hypothetical protein
VDVHAIGYFHKRAEFFKHNPPVVPGQSPFSSVLTTANTPLISDAGLLNYYHCDMDQEEEDMICRTNTANKSS